MIRGLLLKNELEVDSDSDTNDKVEEDASIKRKCEVDCFKIADQVLDTTTSNLDLNKPKQHLMHLDSKNWSGSSPKHQRDEYNSKPNKCMKLSYDHHQQCADKEKIESLLNESIKRKDVKRADRLNDQLIQMEMVLQRKQTDDAKKFEAKRDAELQDKIKKRRKKLKWTFEPKHRWETKSNM